VPVTRSDDNLNLPGQWNLLCLFVCLFIIISTTKLICIWYDESAEITASNTSNIETRCIKYKQQAWGSCSQAYTLKNSLWRQLEKKKERTKTAEDRRSTNWQTHWFWLGERLESDGKIKHSRKYWLNEVSSLYQIQTSERMNPSSTVFGWTKTWENDGKQRIRLNIPCEEFMVEGPISWYRIQTRKVGLILSIQMRTVNILWKPEINLHDSRGRLDKESQSHRI
jgi:hypothetical protein